MPKPCLECLTGFPHKPTKRCKPDESGKAISEAVKRAVGRPQSNVEDMEDSLSTGRKRAAVIAPIPQGTVCEWALLKEAGGGVEPIVGCVGYPAEHRHHGPDKNTLNNERKVNLHLICTYCHNRWHGKNDKYYEGERPKDDTPWVPPEEFKQHNSEDKVSRKEALIVELGRT